MLTRKPNGQFLKDKSLEPRDEQIVADYLQLKKEGRPMISMVQKWGMTTQNIYLILKRYGVLDK